MATSTFAAPVYVPKFRAFTAAGLPLAGGKLFTYLAGTLTPANTYPTQVDALAGTNANANPVILDANGEANVFVPYTPSSATAAGQFYKFILQDSTGAVQWTEDNVSAGSGFPSPYPTEWVPLGTVTQNTTPTFVGATSFSVIGDQTVWLHVGRRIRSTNTAGTIYSTITASSFGAGITTVTVINDSGALDAGLSAVFFGMTSYISPSYLDPRTSFMVIKNGNQVGFAANTKLTTWTVARDSLAEWVAGSNHWLAKYTGDYKITLQCAYSNTVGAIQNLINICDTAGTVLKRADTRSSINVTTHQVDYVARLTGGVSTISAFVLGDANTTVVGPATGDTSLSITRIA